MIVNQVNHARFVFQSESSKFKMAAMGENQCTDVLFRCKESNEILYTTEAFNNTLHICANADQNNNKPLNLGSF